MGGVNKSHNIKDFMLGDYFGESGKHVLEGKNYLRMTEISHLEQFLGIDHYFRVGVWHGSSIWQFSLKINLKK